MRVIQICERQNMALFKKKNHRFIDIWLLIITCHSFPQQLNDGNKSVWNTWGLPTMMQSFQQYNVPRLVLCLCSTTGIASLQQYTSYVSWSQNFQWFTDDIMCPRYLTTVLNIHPHRPSACPVLPLFTLPCPRSDQQWPHVSLTQVGY